MKYYFVEKLFLYDWVWCIVETFITTTPEKWKNKGTETIKYRIIEIELK